MTDRFFIDTNVLVYANDQSNPAKRDAARAVIRRAYESRRGVLSTQVMQEFFVAVTRKAGVSERNARAQVVALMELDTIVVDVEMIIGAIDLVLIHGLSFWDALVVKSASVAKCARLITEDLSNGQVFDGVRIENPFVDVCG